MGFAWMFLGYILLLGTNFEIVGVTLDVTPDVIGFLLLSHGFTVASRYCDCFRVSKVLGTVGVPLSLVYLTAELSSSLEFLPLSGTWLSVINYGYAVFKLIFSLCLYIFTLSDHRADRCRKIAQEVDPSGALYGFVFLCRAFSSVLAASFRHCFGRCQDLRLADADEYLLHCNQCDADLRLLYVDLFGGRRGYAR